MSEAGEEQEHDMAEYQLVGQPTVMREGTYRVASEPIHADVWDGPPDKHGKVHQRGRGTFHISAVITKDGTEDTTPKVFDIVGRTYESFMAKVQDMHDYGVEYDERTHRVVVDDAGAVRIIQG